MKTFYLSAIALCAVVTSYAQGAIEFKLNPEIGKAQQSTIMITTDIDSPQPIIMDLHMNTSATSTKLEEGNISFETMINSVKMDMQSGMETVSYNSQEEATDETVKLVDKQFRPLIGQKISATISPKGKTLDIILPDVGENTLSSSSFANQFLQFPEHAIKPGESWTTLTDVEDNPIMTKMELNNTFKEITADGYIVSYVGSFLDGEGKKRGTIEGEYLLDTKTFMPITSKAITMFEMMDTKIKSTVEVTVN